MRSTQSTRAAGSILIVDDDLATRQTLSALMEREGYEVRCAPSGQMPLMFPREEPPDLVLLDIRLPEMDGLQVCRRLKEDSRTQTIPVILLSALEDLAGKIEGFAAGGVDYIIKPFQAEDVLARVRMHVMLHRLQSDLRRRVEEQMAALRATNAQLTQSIEALNRSEGALKERLQFETLLADLSARFVNVPADRVDREVEGAQRRICECLGLDLSALWQGSMEEPGVLVLTHLYRPLGGPEVPERVVAKDYFPWALQKVLSGESLVIPRHADLPAEAARDQAVWRQYGVKSTVVFPLSAGGDSVFGILSFDAMQEERAWPEPLVQRLRLVA